MELAEQYLSPESLDSREDFRSSISFMEQYLVQYKDRVEEVRFNFSVLFFKMFLAETFTNPILGSLKPFFADFW